MLPNTVYTPDALLAIGRQGSFDIPFKHDIGRVGPVLSDAEPQIKLTPRVESTIDDAARSIFKDEVKRALKTDVDSAVLTAAEEEPKLATPTIGDMDWGSLDIKPPVLLDFVNPFAIEKPGLPRRPSMGSEDGNWRRRSDSTSSMGSVGSLDIPTARPIPAPGAARPSSISRSGSMTSLNPFAPPFPLPEAAHSTHNARVNAAPSLPMPMPSSLPKRPGALPPVFVKKESATLPQPMGLPAVAPLSHAWNGVVSGNERRRRSSSVSTDGAGPIAIGVNRSLKSDDRPQHLKSLGSSLRASTAQRIM